MGGPNSSRIRRSAKHKEISAARLPQMILIRIFENLDLKGLGRVMMVCTRWKKACENAVLTIFIF
jgi:hypothetical protein